MRDKIKYKLLATSIHMLLSLLIFAVVTYLIVFEWYPDGLFTADGGLTGLKLMAVIDFILGPSLTFIIYNHMKSRKEIFFDLSIIAIIQISALIWGGLQIYSQRPVALVLWEGVFYPVTENYYESQGVSVKEMSVYSDESPLLIYSVTDHSVKQLKEIQRLNGKKIPAYAQVHLYRSVKDSIDAVLLHQLSDDYLTANMPEYVADSNLYVLPGNTKYKNLLIYLDANGNLAKTQAITKR